MFSLRKTRFFKDWPFLYQSYFSSKKPPKMMSKIKNQSKIGSRKDPTTYWFVIQKLPQNGPQIPPKIVPKSILGPPWAQKCAKDGPRESPTTNFDVFSLILAPFLTDFGTMFDRFWMTFVSASQVRPTSEPNNKRIQMSDTSEERYESITIPNPVLPFWAGGIPLADYNF